MRAEPTRRSPGKGRKGISANLILAALLIFVCGFAYWLEVRKKPELERRENEKKHLLTIDSESVLESLKVVDKDKDVDFDMRCASHCKLSDPAAEWELTSPIKFKADGGNVGTFVTGVAALTASESLPIEGDREAALKQFGLDKDKREQHKAVIKFKKDAAPYTLYLGDNAAVGDNMYVLFEGPGVKGDTVRIVPSYLRTNLQRSLSYWRAKKLFDFAASEVEALRLKNPSGTVNLKREDGNWYLMPRHQLADNEAVDTFITGLVFMNAHEFVSDDKVHDSRKFGISPKQHHYELAVKPAKRDEVKVNIYDFVKGKEPHLYAVFADRNYIVSLDRTNADKFTKKAESFRFRNLLTAAEKEQVGEVELTLGGKDKYEFKREDSGWKLKSGKIDGFDPAKVDAALTKVGSARIAEFEAKKAVPRNTPELSAWVLKDKAGKTLRSFAIYGSVSRGEYFARMANGELGRLDRGAAAAVPSKADDFKKK